MLSCRKLTTFALVVLCASCSFGQESAETDLKLFPLKGEVKELQKGFTFTEGPAWDGKGNLYFTDIPNAKIHILSADNELSVFTDTSGHANGLMFDGDGCLLACEMDGQVVIYVDGKKADRKVIAGKFDDKRFNAPNDLVIDKTGGVYFTDPHFRAPEPLPQGATNVYYRTAKGEIKKIVEGIPAPNGVILSPDETKLYVIPSGQKEMMVYEVKSPGELGEGKVFCTLHQPAGKDNTGGDGLTIDSEGNLYITTGLGLQVFAADGEFLGLIQFPQQPANVTFGGEDLDTLYVTARTSLYSVKVDKKGHRFTGDVEVSE